MFPRYREVLLSTLGLMALLATPSLAINRFLGIGNGNYTVPSGWTNLEYCVAPDRINMGAHVVPCGYAGPMWNDRDEAQMRTIVQGSYNLAAAGEPFLFYYTGHGSNGVQNGALVGVDGVLYTPANFAADNMPAKALKRVYIFDSCGSGGFSAAVKAAMGAGPVGDARVFFGATPTSAECGWCWDDDHAPPPTNKGSYFTYAIWLGLNGAADGACGGPGDGAITVKELDCWLDGNAYDTNPNIPPAHRNNHYYDDNGGMWENLVICGTAPTLVPSASWGRLKVIYR